MQGGFLFVLHVNLSTFLLCVLWFYRFGIYLRIQFSSFTVSLLHILMLKILVRARKISKYCNKFADLNKHYFLKYDTQQERQYYTS